MSNYKTKSGWKFVPFSEDGDCWWMRDDIARGRSNPRFGHFERYHRPFYWRKNRFLDHHRRAEDHRFDEDVREFPLSGNRHKMVTVPNNWDDFAPVRAICGKCWKDYTKRKKQWDRG